MTHEMNEKDNIDLHNQIKNFKDESDSSLETTSLLENDIVSIYAEKESYCLVNR